MQNQTRALTARPASRGWGYGWGRYWAQWAHSSSEGCDGRYLLDWDTAPFSWFLISLSHLLAASGLRGIVGDEGWLCPESPRPNHAQPRRRCCTSQAWWWWAVQWLWWCGDWILMWQSEWLMRPRFLLWPGEHCCRHESGSSGLYIRFRWIWCNITIPHWCSVHVHVKYSACETVLNILVFSLKRKGADSEESRFEVWKMKIDNVTSVGEILSLEKEGRIKLVIRDH